MDVNRALRLRHLRYPQGKGAAYFSEIETYFAYEQYKQIKYVFDRNQFGIIRKMRQEGYPVPVPDVLHIELRAWSGTDDILCQRYLSGIWKKLSAERRSAISSSLFPVRLSGMSRRNSSILLDYYAFICSCRGSSVPFAAQPA